MGRVWYGKHKKMPLPCWARFSAPRAKAGHDVLAAHSLLPGWQLALSLLPPPGTQESQALERSCYTLGAEESLSLSIVLYRD